MSPADTARLDSLKAALKRAEGARDAAKASGDLSAAGHRSERVTQLTAKIEELRASDEPAKPALTE